MLHFMLSNLLNQVEYICPLYQAASLLSDPDLKDGFLDSYNELEVDGERAYSELNTGDWWKDTEAIQPEVMLYLICKYIMYLTMFYVTKI